MTAAEIRESRPPNRGCHGQAAAPPILRRCRQSVPSAIAQQARILRRVLLDKFGQRLHVFHRRFRQNAVAQIEDWPGRPAARCRISSARDLNSFQSAKSKTGSRLPCTARRTQASPAFIERNAPVQADDFRSGFSHRRQQRRAVGSEINDRHAGLLQLLYQFGRARQNVTAIVFDAEASHPAIENLNYVRSGSHLLGRVFGDDRDQFRHQFVPCRGDEYIIFLAMNVIARASAFDHVAGQGEGRAAKTNHGQARSEMLAHQANGFGNITQVGGAISAQTSDVFSLPQRLFDHRAFAGRKMEWKSHHFERQAEDRQK